MAESWREIQPVSLEPRQRAYGKLIRPNAGWPAGFGNPHARDHARGDEPRVFRIVAHSLMRIDLGQEYRGGRSAEISFGKKARDCDVIDSSRGAYGEGEDFAAAVF